MNHYILNIILITIFILNLIIGNDIKVIHLNSENETCYNPIYTHNYDGNVHWWDKDNKIWRNEIGDLIESEIYKIDFLIYKIPNNF